jgi:hypothetical protein
MVEQGRTPGERQGYAGSPRIVSRFGFRRRGVRFVSWCSCCGGRSATARIRSTSEASFVVDEGATTLSVKITWVIPLGRRRLENCQPPRVVEGATALTACPNGGAIGTVSNSRKGRTHRAGAHRRYNRARRNKGRDSSRTTTSRNNSCPGSMADLAADCRE